MFDADLLGVERVHRVLGVDERAHAAELLGLGDDVVGQRRLARGLRAEDLDDAPARDAADAQREVERQRARGDRLHPDLRARVAHAHDRALAELALDLRERALQGCVFGLGGLVGIGAGHGGSSRAVEAGSVSLGSDGTRPYARSCHGSTREPCRSCAAACPISGAVRASSGQLGRASGSCARRAAAEMRAEEHDRRPADQRGARRLGQAGRRGCAPAPHARDRDVRAQRAALGRPTRAAPPRAAPDEGVQRAPARRRGRRTATVSTCGRRGASHSASPSSRRGARRRPRRRPRRRRARPRRAARWPRNASVRCIVSSPTARSAKSSRARARPKAASAPRTSAGSSSAANSRALTPPSSSRRTRCSATTVERSRTSARPPGQLHRAGAAARRRGPATEKQTWPTGLASVPPPGPATPVMPTPMSAPSRARAPSASASATSVDTAPTRSMSAGSTPASSVFAALE